VDDLDAALALGVEVIGLNFWPGSPRLVSDELAAELIDRAQGRARIVGVFVDAPLERLLHLQHTFGIAIQLHGSEPDATLLALLPEGYRAVRLRDEADVARALASPGSAILIDAAGPQPGGTGLLADATLAAQVCRARDTWLAGGLGPDNVRARIEKLAPFGVDVASGVESSPGIKDHRAMEAFVRAVRG